MDVLCHMISPEHMAGHIPDVLVNSPATQRVGVTHNAQR